MGADDRTKANSHAPLTVLIDHFASTDHPIVFQAAFEGEPDLTAAGEYHIDEIEHGRETLWDEAAVALEELLRGPKNSESSSPRSESLSESQSERIAEIRNEDWGHTFTTNLRAVTVPTSPSRSDTSEIDHYLRNLSTVFDPLAGDYYKLEGETLHGKGALERSKRKRSRRCFNRVLEGEVVSGGKLSRSEPDLHLDPAELCNLVIVPSTEHLTDEAVKETHANPESRTALPGLDAAQRRQYTTGMVLGQDANSAVEGPLRLPPGRQTRHWLLCGATGSGKSQVTNRILRSLAETTPGPNVLFEPKGDNMCLNYLMAHYQKFGDLDDVYYFREPGTLPAISFFDIRPALEAGHDRETAVKEKADHFHALMRMILGAEKHEQAFVANEILTFLIYALFDPKHGDDVFGLDDFVDAATRMHRHQELPGISDINADIHDSLASQFAKDEHQFDTTMGAVLNRLNRLKEDRHLHWMLRYKPGRKSNGDDLYGFHQQETHFDFSEFLDEDVTILFDLGDLTLDAQRGFTTVLLSNLWHAIQRRRRTNPENVVNVILEEAAPFVATELVADQLLPQGRSSGLSLGFIMQYPEQVKSWDDGNGAYEELLTEVHTKLIGDISMTDRFAKTFTHDELSVEDVRNRNNRMAAGEWFTKLVSPGFGEDRPAPLTLHSMPIVSGHPESDEPLTAAEQQQFDEELLPEVIERTEDEYGLYVPTHEDAMEWSNWSDTDQWADAPPVPDGDEREETDEREVVDPEVETEDADAQQPFDEFGPDDGDDDRPDERDDSDLTAQADLSDSSEAETTDNDPADVASGAVFFDPPTDEEECPVPDRELHRRRLSRDDAIFLKRVLDAMNRDLPGYTLLEGMDELQEDLDEVDVEVLIEQELLERGKVDRRPYYTVLPAGREVLGETLTAEEGIGDLGEKTPHKVGVELLVRWLEILEEVDRVVRYYQQSSETVFDVAAFGADDDLVWVGEVEMSSNNAEAVVSDYEKMAAVDADVVWAFPSRDDAREIANVLADAERLPGSVSGRAARSFAQIQERVESFEAAGMTTVQTFRKMEKKVTGDSS
ncbi:ATP-binding protein [Natrinema soli]|uniref:ATP-binding protein n=1 Tax=Natrinema soli TaxID=1930624 RepID=A0ABD5SJ54_9EURY|nr:ATP-binding protein [Natrinema soli]